MLFYYCFEVSSVVSQSFTEPVGIAFYINQITVGRRTQDYIRQAALQATAKKLTTGQTVRQMQQDLQNKLVDSKITSVAYANGTEHNIKDYAAMVARTTTAETQNTAQVVQGNAWGYDLVRMTSHYPTCEVCAMYQGRVYALTKEAANGKYKGKNGKPLRFAYLYDTALVDGYNTIHPNCRHRFAIFPANAYTKDELAEFSRQSMQPFADLRSDTERKAYAREQAVKRKKGASRRQYEEIKQYLPEQVPKTFAAWQRMKHTKSQRYIDLVSDYRSIKKIIASSSQNGIIGVDKKDISAYIGKEITKKDSQHIREWYYANVTDIPNQIDKSQPFETQVKQAFELRNKYKHSARAAMSDAETAEFLDRKRPAPSFEELLNSKMERKKLTREEALRDILKNPDNYYSRDLIIFQMNKSNRLILCFMLRRFFLMHIFTKKIF